MCVFYQTYFTISSNVSCFFDLSISGHLKQLHCWEQKCFALIVFVVGGFSTRWVDLHVIAEKIEKMKICSFLLASCS